MKIVLASYFEPENHGPGRKIGITSGKPRDVECDFKFEPLDPGDLYWDYKNGTISGEQFVEGYNQKMRSFVDEVKAEAEDGNVFEVLPFEEGDTLMSWEHSGHLTFRRITAEYLRELGYDVVEN